MAKFKYVEWLLIWLRKTVHFEFEWDDGNRTKSFAKHSVTIQETEEVFLLKQVAPLGIQISPPVPEERLAILGTTLEGRLLHVVFTMRGNRVRPISVRPANRKDRKFYENNLLR